MAAALLGASFGVLARSAGLGALAPIVMSATTFAGSAQLAAVAVIGAGGAAAAAVAAAVLLNARYGPMGLAAAGAFRGGRLRRAVEAQLVVDEAWALASRPGGRFARRVLIGAGLVLYVGWVAGTAVGVAAGEALGDTRSLGLDAAFPALFLALLVPQLRSGRAVAAALAGGGIAAALTPVAPAGVPLLAAAGACVIGIGPREKRRRAR